jgi:cytidine deaminase
MKISKKDLSLVEEAKTTVKRLFVPNNHGIAAVLATKSGKFFSAVNLNAYTGKVDVCAEAIVIGKAIAEGEKDFSTIVVVRHPRTGDKVQKLRVVPPCGVCRELILDYGVKEIIISRKGKMLKISPEDLLPDRFYRDKE